MIENVVKYALSNVFMILFLASFIVAALQSIKGPHKKAQIVECFLSNFILFNVSLSLFYNFIMHVFFGNVAAAYIGWAQSPFQAEVGFASLGMSVAGILAYKSNYGMRLIAIISPTIFLWGAAAGHVYQMIVSQNFAPGNAGFVFWWDIFIPIILLILLKTSKGLEISRSKGN